MLNLELTEVPDFSLMYFTRGERNLLRKHGANPDEFNRLWHRVKDIWLLSKGYEETEIKDIDLWRSVHTDKPYMVSGKRWDGTDHVVIYKNGKLYHDPHPDGMGLLSIWTSGGYTYLMKMEHD